MSRHVISVPTVKDDDSGYYKILKIAREVLDNPKRHFDFDFSACSKIEHNAVVVLGALARYVDYQNTLSTRVFSGMIGTKAFASAGVMFRVNTMSEVVFDHLLENSFLSHFSSGYGEDYPSGGYIGYREHNNLLDADNIAEHLQEEWLSADKLSLSALLKSAVVSRIFEIFMNAYGHGVSIQNIDKLGVYSCGQYDKKEKKLNISVLDFGPGIVSNVLSLRSDLSDSLSAMKWALVRGNSTRTDSKIAEMPRGLGFDLLNEFVCINEGELRIYSNDVSVISSKPSGFVVQKSKIPFDGTLVSININCDDRHYQFASENASSTKKYF
ncbi:MAG: hypothetical protein ACX933_07480 [Marinobacter adhaerens]